MKVKIPYFLQSPGEAFAEAVRKQSKYFPVEEEAKLKIATKACKKTAEAWKRLASVKEPK